MLAEYQQRQREAAANKMRGQAQWGAPNVQLPPHTPVVAGENKGVVCGDGIVHTAMCSLGGNAVGGVAKGKNKAEEVSFTVYNALVGPV